MNLVIGLIITLVTYSVMEFVAWFTHKFVMHGFLWSWHRDHHVSEPGFFQKNDRFFLIFAIPSATFFIRQFNYYDLDDLGRTGDTSVRPHLLSDS